ncbi:MAG: hypothetical protein RL536_263 [Candidatus Parcubacteria bacterium]|jgi:hypothetical protein
MNRGYIIIFNTILFVAILVVLLVGVVNPIISNYSSAQASMSSKKAFLLVDSATEEAIYRLKNGKNIAPYQNLNLAQGMASIAVTNTSSGKKIETSSAVGSYQKNTVVNVSIGTGISFHYGIQAGDGGFSLNNSSSITGNVFSSGPIVGSGNYIRGEVISAGSSGLVDNIHATGTVYSHTIQNSIIDRDAYYVTKTNTTVAGTSYPGSADQPIVDLPITDAQIATWEGIAASSTATCSDGKYSITSSVSIGNLKIPCNLEIKGSGITVTVTGHLWVVGNITTQVSPTIRISSALGSSNVAIIADNPAASTTSGLIDIGQNTSFAGSGSPSSFVFMISQNGSAENGGDTDAINMGQGASALVVYAIHGQITMAQSVSVKEATAYKIILKNSANVVYDTGLPNALFSAGPGGGYNMVDWTEI